jgi:hypothetical protein
MLCCRNWFSEKDLVGCFQRPIQAFSPKKCEATASAGQNSSFSMKQITTLTREKHGNTENRKGGQKILFSKFVFIFFYVVDIRKHILKTYFFWDTLYQDEFSRAAQ